MADFDALRDAAGRERAIAAALQEFDHVAQGNPAAPRLIVSEEASRLRNDRRRRMSTVVTWRRMTWRSEPVRWAAVAALLVAVVSVPLVLRVADPGVAPVSPPIASTPPGPTSIASAPPVPHQDAMGGGVIARLLPAAPVETEARDEAAIRGRLVEEAARRQAAAEAARKAQDSTTMAMVAPPSPPRTAEGPSASRSSGYAAPLLAAPRSPVAPSPPHPPGLGILPPRENPGTARYPSVETGGFKRVAEEPVSTFSIDVDTTAYAVVRAHLNRGRLPPASAVRTEELVNYFPYAYARPQSRDLPFAVTTTLVPSPWAPQRRLLHVAVQGWEIPAAERKRANLVLLVDVSGSMGSPNRLPLAKSALALLIDTLRPDDTVSIVTYAGHAGVALEPTRIAERARIRAVVDRLQAGGSTAGFDGIATAYRLAREHFADGGVNRVLLMTDGDFNVGPTSGDALKTLVTDGRKAGIYLSVLGFGMSNYQDTTMQTLAQNGNGNAAYIDTLSEARKVLVDEANATVFPIADDVKIQVEFNPAAVSEYRLLGYETRMLRREDFSDDKVDAGEVGSGAVVTAIYEIVPVGRPATVDPLRYAPRTATVAPSPAPAKELAFLRLRWKRPGEPTSRLIERPIETASLQEFASAGSEPRFAVAVAGFAELLRGGRHQGSFGYADVLKIAAAARGEDPFGWRSEFLGLVRLADSLSRSGPASPTAERP
jgi:Ca-activated chloride channel family protein